MNRQYIGARYVPIFADPITWDSNKSYEALTIVEYLGSSYTSKKNVPSGIEPTNKDYWVQTGNYNAQIEEYRRSVEALKNNFLFGKKCAFFGDSITYGTMPDNTRAAKPYPNVFADITGCDIVNYARNGASMCSLNSGTNNLENQLKDADLSDVDYVFICFGENDFNNSSPLGSLIYSRDNFNTFYNSMAKACNVIKSKGKEGVIIAFISTLYGGTAYTNRLMTNGYPCTVRTYGEAVKRFCIYNNVTYVDLLNSSYKNSFTYTDLSGGSVHLTQGGYISIGYTLARVFTGCSPTLMQYLGNNIAKRWLFKNTATTFSGGTNVGTSLRLSNETPSLTSKANVGMAIGYVRIKCHVYADATDYTSIGDKKIGLNFKIGNKLIGKIWDIEHGFSHDYIIDCYCDTNISGLLTVEADCEYSNYTINILNLEIISERTPCGETFPRISLTPTDTEMFSALECYASYNEDGSTCTVSFKGTATKSHSGEFIILNVPRCNEPRNTNNAVVGFINTTPIFMEYFNNNGALKMHSNIETGQQLRFSISVPV